MKDFEVNALPVRQQRECLLCMPLEGFRIVNPARFDDKSEISARGKLVLEKPVDLSPVAPMLQR